MALLQELYMTNTLILGTPVDKNSLFLGIIVNNNTSEKQVNDNTLLLEEVNDNTSKLIEPFMMPSPFL